LGHLQHFFPTGPSNSASTIEKKKLESFPLHQAYERVCFKWSLRFFCPGKTRGQGWWGIPQVINVAEGKVESEELARSNGINQ